MKYTYKENKLTYNDYIELRKAVNWNNWSKSQIEKAIKNSYYTLTIFDENKAIGMGRVVGDGIYLTIVDIVVRPEYQGQKIGSFIIHRMLEYIEAKMEKESRVSIQLIAEIGKEEFYIKQGFEIIPNEVSGSALRKILFK